MSILDLRCLESVCTAKDCRHIESGENYLHLGFDYQIYLSFEQPPYSTIKSLLQAKLLLFKIPIPCEEGGRKCEFSSYVAYPLLEYFSSFSCMYVPPTFDYSLGEYFKNSESCCYTEADISCIVRAWLDQKIEDKGLLLTGKGGSGILTFASDTYDIKGMRPVIRLNYEERICEPLSSVPCIVKLD